MNGKFEEKLAQLAFGDLSPAEAKKFELEAEQNPEARRALILYKDMRDGLRSLADIPDDQFSKERLRDAILTQGLKPTPSRPVTSRTWLWMPVAACALGFGMMFMRHSFDREKHQPEIVMGKNSIKSTPLFTIEKPIHVAVNSGNHVIAGDRATAHSVRNAFMSVSRHGSRKHKETTELSPDVSTGVIFDPDLEFGSFEPIPTAGAVPPSKDVGSPAPESGPIVLIDQDKDAQTGAQRATEVTSASNVLVGG